MDQDELHHSEGILWLAGPKKFQQASILQCILELMPMISWSLLYNNPATPWTDKVWYPIHMDQKSDKVFILAPIVKIADLYKLFILECNFLDFALGALMYQRF